MKSTILTFTAFALSCGIAQASVVNLVSNGSFEQGPLSIGSFLGWTTTLGDISTYVDTGNASNGIWSAYFGSTATDGGASISQNLATTANQVYVLSFDLANSNGGFPAANAFTASVAGNTLFSVSNLGDQNFAHEQFTFTATGVSTLLRLTGSNDQAYFDLDNISVLAAPEPSALALMAMCPILLYLGLRKRDAQRLWDGTPRFAHASDARRTHGGPRLNVAVLSI